MTGDVVDVAAAVVVVVAGIAVDVESNDRLVVECTIGDSRSVSAWMG
jgi:hypothetical protein